MFTYKFNSAATVAVIVTLLLGISMGTMSCKDGAGSGGNSVPEEELFPGVGFDPDFGYLTLEDYVNKSQGTAYDKVMDSITVATSMEEICMFLGGKPGYCADYDAPVRFPFFRTYFALTPKLPGLVITRVDAKGQEHYIDEKDGSKACCLFSYVPEEGKAAVTDTITKKEADTYVHNFQNAYKGGVQNWSFNYQDMQVMFPDLKSGVVTHHNELPENVLNANFDLEGGELKVSFQSKFGPFELVEIFPFVYYQDFSTPCPPHCGSGKKYLFPPAGEIHNTYPKTPIVKNEPTTQPRPNGNGGGNISLPDSTTDEEVPDSSLIDSTLQGPDTTDLLEPIEEELPPNDSMEFFQDSSAFDSFPEFVEPFDSFGN